MPVPIVGSGTISTKSLWNADKCGPLTAALLSPTQIFLATDLRFTHTNMESTERIERVELPFDEVLRMVIESEITHAPSCVAILKANFLIQKHRQV